MAQKRHFARLRWAVALLVVVAAALGCAKDDNPDPAYARGKTTYMATCIACHNIDPRHTGAVGPALLGVRRDVLRLKILEGKAPEGYMPKRTTHAMPVMPQLSGQLDDLAVFLRAQ